jgi:hypothetical protein
LGWGQEGLDEDKSEEGGTGSLESGREPPTRQVHKREQAGWAEGDREEGSTHTEQVEQLIIHSIARATAHKNGSIMTQYPVWVTPG